MTSCVLLKSTKENKEMQYVYHRFPKPYQYYQQSNTQKASILHTNWETPPYMYDINLTHEIPNWQRSCESIYGRRPILP